MDELEESLGKFDVVGTDAVADHTACCLLNAKRGHEENGTPGHNDGLRCLIYYADDACDHGENLKAPPLCAEHNDCGTGQAQILFPTPECACLANRLQRALYFLRSGAINAKYHGTESVFARGSDSKAWETHIKSFGEK